jgi:hypothetical protein
VDFAEVLREHWPRYVEDAREPIPSRAWSAVEAVLSCRTERRGTEKIARASIPHSAWGKGSITAFEARGALKSSCMVPDMGNARFRYAC